MTESKRDVLYDTRDIKNEHIEINIKHSFEEDTPSHLNFAKPNIRFEYRDKRDQRRKVRRKIPIRTQIEYIHSILSSRT